MGHQVFKYLSLWKTLFNETSLAFVSSTAVAMDVYIFLWYVNVRAFEVYALETYVDICSHM